MMMTERGSPKSGVESIGEVGMGNSDRGEIGVVGSGGWATDSVKLVGIAGAGRGDDRE